MDAEALGCIDERYNQPGDRLFRMEILPEYEVASDGDDFQRWFEGATEPTWTRKQPWLDTLHRGRGNGQISTRVLVLSEQVTDYERYAWDFGSRYNGRPVEVFPHTAFHLYDEAAVVVGTRDGTAIINDSARLADYRGLFDELAGLASFSDAARDVLQRIIDDYRRPSEQML